MKEHNGLRLGDFIVIRKILEGIVGDGTVRELLHGLLARGGVPAGDFDAVIDKTWEIVIKLAPRDDIAAALSRKDADDADPRLRGAVQALFVCYLSYGIKDHVRGMWDTHVDPNAGGNLMGCFASSRDLRDFLASLSPLLDVDVDAVFKNRRGAVSKLYDALFRAAGLTDEERAFVDFRMANPKARDQDFDPGRCPAWISTRKTSAFRKISRLLFFGDGRPAGRTEETRNG